MSAFLYACEHGYPDVVARLMEAGCAQHATNRENYSGAADYDALMTRRARHLLATAPQ
jgi:hypothetical protein